MGEDSIPRRFLAFSATGTAYIGDPAKMRERCDAGDFSLGLSCLVPLKPTFEDVVWQITLRGLVKCTPAVEFTGAARRAGIRGVDLDEDDQLVAVFAIRQQSDCTDIVIASARGVVTRFGADEVCPMRRNSRGVRGINLDGDLDETPDTVAAAFPLDVANADGLIGLATERGYAICFPVSDLLRRGRASKGVIAGRTNDETGPVRLGAGLLRSKQQMYTASLSEAGSLNWSNVTVRSRNTTKWSKL